MITLETLRSFCTVVDTAHFQQAAQRLHRTQPAISQQIKRLESELGQVLLDRKTNTPTPAGHVVYEKGRALLDSEESLRKELLDFDESAGRDLRVGTSDTSALYYLPQFVKAFKRSMPQTRLVIQSRSSDLVADAVEDGELDVGIITLPMDRTGLAIQELYQQRMLLIVPGSHILSAQKSTTLSRLKPESFVLLDSETRTGRLINHFFDQHGFTPQISMNSGSFEVIKRYVAEGVGVSIVPEEVMASEENQNIHSLHLRDLPQVSIGAIWRRGRYITKAAQVFLDMLMTHDTATD